MYGNLHQHFQALQPSDLWQTYTIPTSAPLWAGIGPQLAALDPFAALA
jgi:hypothetical protein